MKYLREMNNNKGVAAVEVILILVVIISLVIIFKDQITTLVEAIWKSINSNAHKIY